MNARLRVAMIGAGWVTQHHLPAWALLRPAVHVVAIADPDRAAREARAAHFAIDMTFADAESMLDAVEPDAVDICSPRQFHEAHVRAAAERGIAALCQKPLAPTLDRARQLICAIDGKARLMVHENWRFRPYYRHIRKVLERGELGVPHQTRMIVESSGLVANPEKRFPSLEAQPFIATLDRMLVAEVLIHHLDTLRYLLGPLSVVAASLGRGAGAIRGESCATVLMRGPCDSSVLLSGDMGVHGAPPKLTDALQIAGETATLVLREGAVTLTRGGAPSASRLFELDQCYQQAYNAAIAHFVDALRADTPFETSPADNLETLRLVEDVYRFG